MAESLLSKRLLANEVSAGWRRSPYFYPDSSGASPAVASRMAPSSAERPRFRADANPQHGGVQHREHEAVRHQPEDQRQHQDLGGDDAVVGMRHEAIRPRCDERRAG